MRYEGTVYRPPSEANSLIIQVTIGCAYNKCTFCNQYKTKKFRIRDINDVLDDLKLASLYYSNYYIEKIFLADGNALVCNQDYLIKILKEIKKLFPECQRVGVYARAKDILNKTENELIELKTYGLGICYIGVESGNNQVLKNVNKDETCDDLIKSIKKINKIGIDSSITIICGLGGKKLSKEHAIDTAKLINESNPKYASCLTLMLMPGTKLYDDYKNDKFDLLTNFDVIDEMITLIENINVGSDCIFRSNHASNYISIKGTFPYDKASMLNDLKFAKKHKNILKDEVFRGL